MCIGPTFWSEANIGEGIAVFQPATHGWPLGLVFIAVCFVHSCSTAKGKVLGWKEAS